MEESQLPLATSDIHGVLQDWTLSEIGMRTMTRGVPSCAGHRTQVLALAGDVEDHDSRHYGDRKSVV